MHADAANPGADFGVQFYDFHRTMPLTGILNFTTVHVARHDSRNRV